MYSFWQPLKKRDIALYQRPNIYEYYLYLLINFEAIIFHQP